MKKRFNTMKLRAFACIPAFIIVSCDFDNPLSEEKLPLKQGLMGHWQSGNVVMTISKGKAKDTYKMTYTETKEEDGTTTKESTEFIGWVSSYQGKDFMQMRNTEAPKKFIIGEISQGADDKLVFKRINRDFPGKFDASQQGEQGLSGLSTEKLREHVKANIAKPRFYVGTQNFTKVEADNP